MVEIVVTPIEGVNINGNEGRYVADPLISPAGGPPRVPLLTTVVLVGNNVAMYVKAKAAINPGATCSSIESTTSASVAGTTGTGFYLSLNSATCATADFIWVKKLTANVVG